MAKNLNGKKIGVVPRCENYILGKCECNPCRVGDDFPAECILPDWQEPEKPVPARRGPNGERITTCQECDCDMTPGCRRRYANGMNPDCPLLPWAEPEKPADPGHDYPEGQGDCFVRVPATRFYSNLKFADSQREKIEEQAARIRELEEKPERKVGAGFTLDDVETAYRRGKAEQIESSKDRFLEMQQANDNQAATIKDADARIRELEADLAWRGKENARLLTELAEAKKPRAWGCNGDCPALTEKEAASYRRGYLDAIAGVRGDFEAAHGKGEIRVVEIQGWERPLDELKINLADVVAQLKDQAGRIEAAEKNIADMEDERAMVLNRGFSVDRHLSDASGMINVLETKASLAEEREQARQGRIGGIQDDLQGLKETVAGLKEQISNVATGHSEVLTGLLGRVYALENSHDATVTGTMTTDAKLTTDPAPEWPEVEESIVGKDTPFEQWVVYGTIGRGLTRSQAEGYVRWINAGRSLASGGPALTDTDARRILKGK